MTPIAYLMLGVFGGILVTAPLGPVNVMIIQRALRDGFVSAAFAGVGAAVADVLFATVAAFGVSTVDAFIEGHSRAIQLVGGSLVLMIGLRIVWKQATGVRPALAQNASAASFGWRSLGPTFALTITNPVTIFGFVAYFGSLGEWGPQKEEFWGTIQLILGVGIGTITWWLSLSALVTRVRVRFTDETLSRCNLIAGTILICFGAAILGRLTATYFKLM